MTRLAKGLAALLLALAFTNAGQQTVYIYRTFHHLFFEESSVAHADRVFAPIRRTLNEKKLLKIGYRAEAGVPFDLIADDYYMVQYTLAPVVLRLDAGDEHWVLMNYSKTKRPFPAPDLVCVEDFGYGLALFEKGQSSSVDISADLGSVWQEHEGPWAGTWTRRGDSTTFDALWNGPGGQEIRDEITFESSICHQVTLFRKGTGGRYRGKLSYDGTTITNGTADWFGSADTWSATILR